MSINILQHNSTIDSLYNKSMLAAKSLKELDDLYRFWLTREFDFQLHTPDSCYKKEWNQKSAANSRQKTPAENLVRSRAELHHDNKVLEEKTKRQSILPITDNQNSQAPIAIVTKLDQLRVELFDCQIVLNRHNSKKSNNKSSKSTNKSMNNSIEANMNECLNDLEAFINSLSRCQDMWLFLERIFEEEFFVAAHIASATEFKECNLEFIRILTDIEETPLVLLYTSCGHQILQETQATIQFRDVKQIIERLNQRFNAIKIQITDILQNARHLYPRLYFVSDVNLMQLLSCHISQNIENIQYFVEQCFDGITSVSFDANSGLAFEFGSWMGEKVALIESLPRMNIATQWLKEFELRMKSTMKCGIWKCVQEAATEIDFQMKQNVPDHQQKSSIFKEIDQIDEVIHHIPSHKLSSARGIVKDIMLTYQKWLMRYPLQVLIMTEEICFHKQWKLCLESESSKEELLKLKSAISDKQTNFIKLLELIENNDEVYLLRSRRCIEQLIVLIQTHYDLIQDFIQEESCSISNFKYQSRIKYNLNLDQEISGPVNVESIQNEVFLELFQYQLHYEYEYRDYINISSRSLITERTCVNMVLAMANNDIVSLSESINIEYSIPYRVSILLGRYYADIQCPTKSTSLNTADIHNNLYQLLYGALLSGCILNIRGFDNLAPAILSSLACDLRQIREMLNGADKSRKHKSVKVRRSSSPPKLFQEKNKRRQSNLKKDLISDTDRIDEIEISRSSYYEMQNEKLNKGASCPYFSCNRSSSTKSTNQMNYTPYILGQLNLNQELLDVRCGYGLFTTISQTPIDVAYKQLPSIIKSQLRWNNLIQASPLVNIDVELLLINGQILKEPIKKFLENVKEMLPNYYCDVVKLLPVIIRNMKHYGTPINNLGHFSLFNKSIHFELIAKFNLNSTNHAIRLLSTIVCQHFPLRTDDNDDDDDGEDDLNNSNLSHEIRLQYRIRNEECTKEDMRKILDFKTTIDRNGITILCGDRCSGKSSMVDILVNSINNLTNISMSTSSSRASSSRSRGNLDILKNMSVGRKFPLDIQNIMKIKLRKISLDNFDIDELIEFKFINGYQVSSSLLSILHADLTMGSKSDYQIWIVLETSHDNIDYILSIIDGLSKTIQYKSDYKIIIEQRNVFNRTGIIPDNIGVFAFRNSSDEYWQNCVNEQAGALLKNQLLSYYGSKVVKETGLSMLRELFDLFQIPLTVASKVELKTIFVKHFFMILQAILKNDHKQLKYNHDQFTANLDSLEIYIKTIMCFTLIQTSRGLLFDRIVQARLIDFEEFERTLLEIIGKYCVTNYTRNVDCSSIFGLMLSYDRDKLAPFNQIKGCSLQPMESCMDGLTNYIVQLCLDNNIALQINGHHSRFNDFANGIRYCRRILVNQTSTISTLRIGFDGGSVKYWSVINNETELTNQNLNETCDEEKRQIIIYEFGNNLDILPKFQSLLQFMGYNDHIYVKSNIEGQYKSICSRNLQFIIFVDNNDCNCNATSQNILQFNILDPNLSEAQQIVQIATEKWIFQLPGESKMILKVFLEKFSQFITDSFFLVQEYKHREIIDKIPKKTVQNQSEFSKSLVTPALQKSLASQSSWSQLKSFVDILLSFKLNLFVALIKEMEKKHPIAITKENSDLKVYTQHKSLVRLIRFTVSEMSRTFLDPHSQTLSMPTSPNKIISQIIQDSINKYFCNSPTLNLNELIIKHFPIPKSTITDIIVYPGRFFTSIDHLIKREQFEKPVKSEQDIFYQPLLEPHNFHIIDQTNQSIFSLASLQKFMDNQPFLKSMKMDEKMVDNLVKIYRHLSIYDIFKSFLFLTYNSSLIEGDDYGICISEIMDMKLISPHSSSANSSAVFVAKFKTALLASANVDQKVLLHLDPRNLEFNEFICDFLVDLFQHKSISGLFQLLDDGIIEEIIRHYHPDSFLPPNSNKQFRAARFLMENIERNLKVMITTTENDLVHNKWLNKLSNFTLANQFWHLTLSNESDEVYIRCMQEASNGDFHSCLWNMLEKHNHYRNKYSSISFDFYNSFVVDSHHLLLAVQMLSQLHQWVSTDKLRLKCEINSAIDVVKRCSTKVDQFQLDKQQMQEDLVALGDKINHLGNEAKSLRDAYTNAVVECRGQEDMIENLKEPLEEIKEKSSLELNAISPTYLAALDTIRSLDYDDIEEIKSYIAPPQSIKYLVSTIFLLLGYSEIWEEILSTMVRINLYEELLYFNKDSIDDIKFKKVQKRLEDPDMQPEKLKEVSLAATSLCKWLHAIFKYNSLNREINPQLGKMLSCQDDLNLAQRELGKMKVRTDTMRQDLEEKIRQHRQLQEQKKLLAKQIKDLAYKINSCTHYLSDLERHNNQWKQQITDLDEEIRQLPNTILNEVELSIYQSKFPSKYSNNGLNSIYPIIELSNQSNINRAIIIKDVLDPNDRHSIYLNKVSLTQHIGAILKVQQQTIMLHNYNDCSGRSIDLIGETICHPNLGVLKLLYNEDISQFTTIDASKWMLEELNERLISLLCDGKLIVLKSIDYLDELPSVLSDLLYHPVNSSIANEISPNSRIIIITEQPYSAKGLNGLFRSRYVLHMDVSDDTEDFQDYLTILLAHNCECRLVESLRDSAAQLINIGLEANTIETDIQLKLLQSVNEEPLSDPHAHRKLLEMDSELLSLHESEYVMEKCYKDNLSRMDKYESIAKTITQLLTQFSIFPTAIQTTNQRVIPRICSLQQIVNDVISPTCYSLVDAARLREKADIEVTSEFILKLQNDILIGIIKYLATMLNQKHLIWGLVKFCVNYLIHSDDQYITEDDVSGEMEAEKNILEAILLDEINTELMDVKNNEIVELDFLTNKSKLLIQKIDKSIRRLHGLSHSIITHSKLWKEYLKYNFLSSKLIPGFDFISQPTVLEKLVIWKILKPEQTEEIIEQLILQVFGENVIDDISVFDLLKEFLVKPISSSTIEPLLILNEINEVGEFCSPLQAIESICQKSCKTQNIRLQMIDYLSSNAKLNLKKFINQPIWLVISNIHSIVMEHQHVSSIQLTNHINQFINQILATKNEQIHEDFRLILLAESQNNLEIPEFVLNRSRILFFSTKYNFKSHCKTLKSYTNIDPLDLSSWILTLTHSSFNYSEDNSKSFVTSFNDLQLVILIIKFSQLSTNHMAELVNLVYSGKILEKSVVFIVNSIVETVETSVKSLNHKNLTINQLEQRFLWTNQSNRKWKANRYQKLSIKVATESDLLLSDQKKMSATKLKLFKSIQKLIKMRNETQIEKGNDIKIVLTNYCAYKAIELLITTSSRMLWEINGTIIRQMNCDNIGTVQISEVSGWYYQYLLSNNKMFDHQGNVVELGDWLNEMDKFIDQILTDPANVINDIEHL